MYSYRDILPRTPSHQAGIGEHTCAYVRNVRIRERMLYLRARKVDEVDV
jgi:hypothetical protein